jgi:hypothetical protein
MESIIITINTNKVRILDEENPFLNNLIIPNSKARSHMRIIRLQWNVKPGNGLKSKRKSNPNATITAVHTINDCNLNTKD